MQVDDEKPLYEEDIAEASPDPNEEIIISSGKLITQPYDLVIATVINQIKSGTLFLRPLNDRPRFQRRYVWTDAFASKLIESILLNVPIPQCYLSQNSDFELDVIDGQQKIFSIYRFIENQFKLVGLEILKELNGLFFYNLPIKLKKKIETYTLRCVVITGNLDTNMRFNIFERLNSYTVPLKYSGNSELYV